MIALIAVRHGETDWNRVRRLQGHTDVALNATGIEQAVRLAEALAGEPIGAIHSSDLARARATAEPLASAFSLPVVPHRALRERNYGVLEGKTYAEIVEHHPEEAERMRGRDVTTRFVSGESQAEFYARVVDGVRAIAEAEAKAVDAPARTVLIVTHGGVLDMLYRAANDEPLDAERTWPIPNARINRLDYDGGRFTVRSWAEEP